MIEIVQKKELFQQVNLKKNSIVLDVGCKLESYTSFFKKNLNCQIYGIISNMEKDIFVNKDCYDKIYHLDFFNKDECAVFIQDKILFDYMFLASEYTSKLYLGDILYFLGEKLDFGGKIIFLLPNLAYYSFIYGLLNESLISSPYFFTKESFASFLKNENAKHKYQFDLEVIDEIEDDSCFKELYPAFHNILRKNHNFQVTQFVFILEKMNLHAKLKKLDEIIENHPIDISKIINNRLQEVEELKHKFTKLNDNFDYIYGEYEKMLSSGSWKYTKIFRNIKDILIKAKEEFVHPYDNRQSILFLVHSWLDVKDKNHTNIGGTTLHVLDIINSIKEKKNCYVLTIIHNKYMLVCIHSKSQKIYDLGLESSCLNFDRYDFSFYSLFKTILKELNIDLMHIHHLQGFPCDVSLFTSEIKTIITLHDYYSICPKLFLMNEENFCYQKDRQNCEICIGKYINLNVRNEALEKIFSNALYVISPSQSVIKETNRYFEIKSPLIVPHGLKLNDFVPFSSKNTTFIKKEIYHVAIVGLLDQHKGLDIVKNLIFNANNKKVIYHFFGFTNEKILEQNQENYIFHGAYLKKELPKLLHENHIDLVLLLSVCPESFSFTLSEVAYAKIPMLAFDIGAIGERIKESGIGWLIEKGNDFRYTEIEEKYDMIFQEANYNEVLKKLDAYQVPKMEDSIQKIMNLYNELYSIEIKKNYHQALKFINRYYLRYKI